LRGILINKIFKMAVKKFFFISLLILDENLIDTFDSSFNIQFTILKDFFDEDRRSRHTIEFERNERIEKKDLDKAIEKNVLIKKTAK